MAAREYAFTLTPGSSSRTRSLAISCAAVAAVCVLSSTVVMRELVGAPTARAATPTTVTAAAPATVNAATPTTANAAPPATVNAASLTTANAGALTTLNAATLTTLNAATLMTGNAAATTTARTWALEPRWWSGEIKQSLQSAAIVPDSELTFTKGYRLRLAARQSTQPLTQQAAQPANPPAQVATVPTAENQNGRTATAVRKTTTVAHTEMPTVRRMSATQADQPANPLARFDVGSRALAYDEQRPSERGLALRSAPSRRLFGTLY